MIAPTADQDGSRRRSGVLLHPTSLPGPYGIGDLGPAAFAWVDALARARQGWWQVLPLGPTGYADSPYQCFSAFAANIYLIGPDSLIRDGLLAEADAVRDQFPAEKVDYGPVIDYKLAVLAKAWANFKAGTAPGLRAEFEGFCLEQAAWLDDFAVFMALKQAHGGGSWLAWDADLRRRKASVLKKARRDLAEPINQQMFWQFLAFRYWGQLKAYANRQGVRLIGDIPIFVSSDSSDVWAHPDLFLLDPERQPRVVAGVPPDYFSPTGQLWGNPLYQWKALKAAGYQWWADRLRATFRLVDLARIDHFRGFEAYWEIPAGQLTAEEGRWVKGPGADLFDVLVGDLGQLPIIAEDLGVITPEVDALRERYNLPGMRVLQFAFGGATEDRFLPHNYERNTVVYTGTHDNDTSRGWYAQIDGSERHFVRRYLGRDGHDIAWDLIRLAWSSVADLAVTPLQDVLDLGTEARMNLPGRPSGNWQWRYTDGQLTPAALDRLGELTELYGRC